MSLSKSDPGLKKISVGLGWDVRETEGVDFDLDASCFLTGETGKVRSDADFIFYNQLQTPDGSVQHTGDNLTGEGEGDDESIVVDLSAISPDIFKLAFSVTIHDAPARGQNFGQVSAAFIRVVNVETDNENRALRPERRRFDRNRDDLRRSLSQRGRMEVSRGRSGLRGRFRADGQKLRRPNLSEQKGLKKLRFFSPF